MAWPYFVLAERQPEMMRKSTVAKRLQELYDNWPDGLMLFETENGFLYLVDQQDDYKILDMYNIPCDSGSPNTYVDDDGEEHFVF